MPNRLKSRFQLLSLIGVTVACCLVATPARADNTVTLTILPGGELNAVVTDAALVPIVYTGGPSRHSGTLQLVVSDPRGTSAGWRVTVTSSDFVYQGDSPTAHDIPNTGFRIQSVQDPDVIAGQPIAIGGPHASSVTSASLDIPRTVIWAEPGAGSGDYSQRIGIVLDIPAGSEPGTYVATLTVAFNTGP